MVVGRAKALLISSDGEKYSPEEIEDFITAETNLIDQIMVYNDQKKYTTALITLNCVMAKQMLKDRGANDPEEALKVLEEEIFRFKSRKGHVPGNWLPKTMMLVPEPFSEAQGLINSTMKLVRHKVVERYNDLIEEMYTSRGDAFRNSRNLEVVKTLFFT